MSPSEYQQLIEFLGERFTAIDRRFGTLDGRFETIEKAVRELRADILGHFDALYRRIERLEQEYQSITQALRRIEALLVDERARREVLQRDLATLRENVAVLRARIDELERRLGAS
jgi:chromosome segregation ATPase